MGFKEAKWAQSLKLPLAQKAVLIALALSTDDKINDHKSILGQKAISERTGASVKTVARALGDLEAEGVIARVARFRSDGAPTSSETTLNRDYRTQGLSVTETTGQDDRQSESPRPTDTVSVTIGHHDRSYKEYQSVDQSVDQSDIPSNELEIIIPVMSFDGFWSIWPRKDSKKSAQLAWVKAIKRADSNVIVEAARAYRDNPHIPARQFIPHAATWLNGDRWQDPLPEPPELRRTTRNDGDLAYLHDLQQREAQAQRGITS